MTIRQDLTIRQGETWAYTYTHLDGSGSAVDLTGYSARMAIRTAYGANAEAYLSTGSDASGGTISLGGAAGTVSMSMTAAQASLLPGSDALLYDLELVTGETVTRAIEGRVAVLKGVTE